MSRGVRTDGGPRRRGTGRWRQVAGSVAVGLVVTAVIPAALVAVATVRFGGSAPWTGLGLPDTTLLDAVRSTLERGPTDAVLADFVVRFALVAGWVAVATTVVSIVVELAHRIRHGGIATPRVRGIGWSQLVARYVATGLLLLGPGGPVTAGVAGALPIAGSNVDAHGRPVPVVASLSVARAVADAVTRAETTTVASQYVVCPGDSIMSIADALTGGADETAARRVADGILEVNLGRTMSDGRRFSNPALLEPGWVLDLPDDVAHRVSAGDTLWGLADAHLDDPTRWNEIWDHNRGTEMTDGRTFDDPQLIRVGWELTIPVGVDGTDADDCATDGIDAAGAPTGTDDHGDDRDDGDRIDPAVIVWTADPDARSVDPVPEPVLDDVDEVASSPVPSVDSRPLPVEHDQTELARDPIDDAVDTAAGTPIDVVVDDVADAPVGPTPGSIPGVGDGRSLLGPGAAVMLSGGLLAMVAAVRRRRWRSCDVRARVPAVAADVGATERALHVRGGDERLLRVDLAVRCVSVALADRRTTLDAVTVDADGDVTVVARDALELSAPWDGAGRTWTLPGSLSVAEMAVVANGAAMPSVALVQIGVTPGGLEVFVDLESLGGLAVDASDERADAVVRALATSLATSAFAGATQVITIGLGAVPIPDVRRSTVGSWSEVDQVLVRVAPGSQPAVEDLVARRVRASGGDAWEPSVVFVGSDADSVPASTGVGRHVIAVVAGGPDRLGPSVERLARLVDRGDRWTLELDAATVWDLVPVGIDAEMAAELAQLVADIDRPLRAAPVGDGRIPAPTVDARVAPVDDHRSIDVVTPVSTVPAEWTLMVRILGPVDIVDRHGTPARFARGKSRELVVWLATHRGRATRTGARTALWDADVRDATFANIVSDARRALADLALPPDDEMWIARTLNEDLPLHPLVVTDLDLVETALEAARRVGPEQATALLDPAVELVRGTPFHGTDYLWPDAEGVSTRAIVAATSVTTAAASAHLERGNLDAVFATTSIGLRALPGHEGLIALRLRAHAAAGDRVGVREEWSAYERALAADPWFDGDPAPELLALRHELVSTARNSTVPDSTVPDSTVPDSTVPDSTVRTPVEAVPTMRA